MKKILYMFLVICICALLIMPFTACKTEVTGTVDVEDMVGRTVAVTPGSYQRVVCIGAGALRLYSYVGDVSKLAAVEDIDNTSLEDRSGISMFDKTARPYQMANEDVFNALESCGRGGPQAQYSEDEKILACNPDIIISEYEDVDKASALQEKIGVPVIVVKYGNAGVFDAQITKSIELLGKIFGKETKAQNLIDFIAAEKQDIENRVKDIDVATQKKVYICGLGQWGVTNELMTAQNYAPFNVAKINNVVTGLSKDGIQKIEAEKFLEFASDIDVMILDSAAINNIKANYSADPSMLDACKAWQNSEVYLEMAYNAYYTNVEIALMNTWYYGKVVYPDLFNDIDMAEKSNEITNAFLGKELYSAIQAKPLCFGGYQKIDVSTFFA